MTDSEKLARWQGWEPNEYDVEDFNGNVTQEYEPTPDYLNNDAAAMSLLDTLVERGYMVLVVGLSDDWTCQISIGAKYTRAQEASTRREAVVAAVLELIGREDV